MARGDDASRGIRGTGRRFRPAVAVATVAGIGVVGLIAAAVRPDWRVAYQPFTRTPQTPPPVVPARPSAGLPTALPRQVHSGHVFSAGWLLLIALGIVFALLALAVFLWWRTGRRQRVTEPVEVVEDPEVLTPLTALRAGAAEAERRLLGETDPTNAIIVAWLALEEAASGSGVRRQPSQTPTEFTLSVIEGTGVDPAPVRTLLRLYHRARFSVVGSPPADLAAARRCVSELAAGWQSFTLDNEPLVLVDGSTDTGDGVGGGR